MIVFVISFRLHLYFVHPFVVVAFVVSLLTIM